MSGPPTGNFDIYALTLESGERRPDHDQSGCRWIP